MMPAPLALDLNAYTHSITNSLKTFAGRRAPIRCFAPNTAPARDMSFYLLFLDSFSIMSKIDS